MARHANSDDAVQAAIDATLAALPPNKDSINSVKITFGREANADGDPTCAVVVLEGAHAVSAFRKVYQGTFMKEFLG